MGGLRLLMPGGMAAKGLTRTYFEGQNYGYSYFE
jgi:hypothetical protein